LLDRIFSRLFIVTSIDETQILHGFPAKTYAAVITALTGRNRMSSLLIAKSKENSFFFSAQHDWRCALRA
jgi:hypothetical protein